jgi:hypothetical protein
MWGSTWRPGPVGKMARGMATWCVCAGHAQGAVTMRSPRAVALSPASWWRLASSKVLPVSTGEAPGRRRAWSRGTMLTGKGSSMVRWLGGRKRQCSGVARELWWSPERFEGSCGTGRTRGLGGGSQSRRTKRHGSGEVRRGPESSSCRRWAGRSRGCRVCSRGRGRREKG